MKVYEMDAAFNYHGNLLPRALEKKDEKGRRYETNVLETGECR